MDKGAHFYRCDFQVHSPRDLNWNGLGAVTETQRIEYANEFIKACRSKLLQAVAITDHHDVAFFKYIREAASTELDENNDPIPENQKIVVFPGMELTLGVPCQALIIFDSLFPVDLFQGIYAALGITQTPVIDEKHSQIVRLDHITLLSQVYTHLNQLDYCRDKFIVLPNVSEGGQDTLLRAAFHPKYKEMPCVGGYLDGGIAQLGVGNQRILEGKDGNYGLKKLGLFQTSDNRRRDFNDLGRFSTWIKWAVPTAEALRQACLAKESRISQEQPSFPAIHILSIDISSSKFLGQAYLEFNPQFNAIIGGRGTGKSTILEYLRWGLCDKFPSAVAEEGEEPRYYLRHKNLIDKTLLPFDSTVQISFVKNGVAHVVRRKASGELLLKIANGEFEICTEDNVGSILPIQAYSQKQLSSVGVSLEELKRLLFSPIREGINEFDSRFRQLSSDIRTSYELRRRKRSLKSEIDKLELELKSLSEQADSLRKGIQGISEEDQRTIESHKHYEVAEQSVNGWFEELASAKAGIEEVQNKISSFPSDNPQDVQLSPDELDVITKIGDEVSKAFSEVNAGLLSLAAKLDPEGEALAILKTLKSRWDAHLERHTNIYKTARAKSTAQQSTLNQIQLVDDRNKEIRKLLNEKKQTYTQAGDPEAKFELLKEQWRAAHRAKADLLQAQCLKLEQLSEGSLRASLGRGKGTSELENVFKKVMSGSNFRKDKVEEISSKLRVAPEPIVEWHRVLTDLEILAYVENVQGQEMPNVPVLAAFGFSESDLKKLAEKVTPETWIELFLVQLEDLPDFEYKTREGEYIRFNDASAGQQATALMRVLLNQDGPPLVIDQPEDDLDNQMVNDIATLVWNAKKKRQLIFTSHNANIVVNGDAELVVCCGYKITGDQSKGEIKRQGAIDIKEIRDEITSVMEGGEDAFKLRKEKYGF